MGLLRAATTFSVKDFTVSATTWLTISFRPFLQQAVFFVFNSFFPIMFRANKRVASSSTTASASSSSPAAGGMDVMEVTRPRSAAGPARPPSRMQRKPKPQGPWPRDAGGQ
ncbi:uncharacterized protein BKCO1_3300023 [Diplodia corticola]|uniref:Uncharacterized protein n=1 Tax=Diplodia corticola TaxID=236234 RepID=A0A1J9QYU7_9PEZI|nr:uncharacterized protein BKCO1_3300023 [Diplodia corticola]OJD33170.1 hypothetical protein BKCO1_3300023 [Diplodia corticola]